MNASRRPRIIGPGEVLWDCFPDGRRPGGATANCVFHAMQMGCEGFVISRVGQDEPGDAILDFFRQQGLATDFIQRDPDRPTGWVTVDMPPGETHRFTIHEDVAWDRLEFTPQLAELMPTADAVCFGTLAQRSPLSRETIQRCLYETREDCLLVCDINLRQQFFDAITIERSLQAADIVKLNDDEVRVLSDLLGLPAATHRDFAAGVRERFDVNLVCVTRGAEGCFLNSSTETAEIPGRKVTVVDTVGAGDSFTAALIVSQLEGWPLEKSARFANEVGALVAGRAGAMPRLRDEFQRLKESLA